MDAVRSYYLEPLFWTIFDADEDVRLAKLRFHLDNGDYFPFLATVVGFLKETADTCNESGNELLSAQVKQAEEIRKDLLYLHEHYQLVRKETPTPYSRKKVVRFMA